MAFGGAQVNNLIQQNEAGVARGANMIQIDGLTLLANIGAFAIGAADSGGLTTDNTTTPANYNAIPAAFGPGEGNWLQEDVDAVDVQLWDPTVGAAINVVENNRALVGGNFQLGIHSIEAGIPAGLVVRLKYNPPLIR